jgi:hypothetical protein
MVRLRLLVINVMLAHQVCVSRPAASSDAALPHSQHPRADRLRALRTRWPGRPTRCYPSDFPFRSAKSCLPFKATPSSRRSWSRPPDPGPRLPGGTSPGPLQIAPTGGRRVVHVERSRVIRAGGAKVTPAWVVTFGGHLPFWLSRTGHRAGGERCRVHSLTPGRRGRNVGPLAWAVSDRRARPIGSQPAEPWPGRLAGGSGQAAAMIASNSAASRSGS